MEKKLAVPENFGDFQTNQHVILLNGQKIKIRCEAYQTQKGDSLREIKRKKGEKGDEYEEILSPINQGFHLKFSVVSLPTGMNMGDFKKIATSHLGLKSCKETRGDSIYVLVDKFHHGMTLPECMMTAANWFKKHQHQPKQKNTALPGHEAHNAVVSKLEG
jgi:hypothetical protein